MVFRIPQIHKLHSLNHNIDVLNCYILRTCKRTTLFLCVLYILNDFIGTRNFSSVLRYNRSYFYAAAVAMLANRIAGIDEP